MCGRAESGEPAVVECGWRFPDEELQPVAHSPDSERIVWEFGGRDTFMLHDDVVLEDPPGELGQGMAGHEPLRELVEKACHADAQGATLGEERSVVEKIGNSAGCTDTLMDEQQQCD